MKQILIILFISISLTCTLFAENESVNTAMLLIDIQNFYFPTNENPGLVGAEAASEVAHELLQLFREKSKPIIHIRHQSKKGFEIHKNVTPLPDEKVITKTEINSFLGTDLQEYLQEMKIKRLIIVGMQTHMCLEAAVRAAHDLGYDCIVIEDACATRDLIYAETTIKASAVHASTLKSLTYGGYAKVINFEEFKTYTNKYLLEKF